MSKYYFLSGFDELKGFPNYLIDHFNVKITNRKSLVFICTSPSNVKVNDHYFEINKKWFKEAGIMFEVVSMLDYRLSKIEAQKLLSKADCVFLCGGNTLLQHEFIAEYELKELIKKVDVVMGMSAGAINMGCHSLEAHINEPSIYEGLGLADITVYPHYCKQEVDDKILSLSNDFKIYAMCDDSAIYYESQIELLGEMYKIENSIITKL